MAPGVRRAAFHQFYAEFSDHKFTLAASLTNSVRADVFQARARNYDSAREAVHAVDNVDRVGDAPDGKRREQHRDRRDRQEIINAGHVDAAQAVAQQPPRQQPAGKGREKSLGHMAALDDIFGDTRDESGYRSNQHRPQHIGNDGGVSHQLSTSEMKIATPPTRGVGFWWIF